MNWDKEDQEIPEIQIVLNDHGFWDVEILEPPC